MQKELLNNITENSSLKDIQEYIRKVIKLRGLDNKTVQDEMLMLLEEVGELAKAIRKKLPNSKIDETKLLNYTEIEEEVADVFIVLNSVCNSLNIDIYKAFKDKEEININRKWK
ncbi:MAG: nucleotide pyrophosphohydrolase [Clostridiales bacterium]|nr:nucleotide pyrophosphohydrolase [Clostridiales bacterium]